MAGRDVMDMGRVDRPGQAGAEEQDKASPSGPY